MDEFRCECPQDFCHSVLGSAPPNFISRVTSSSISPHAPSVTIKLGGLAHQVITTFWKLFTKESGCVLVECTNFRCEGTRSECAKEESKNIKKRQDTPPSIHLTETAIPPQRQ